MKDPQKRAQEKYMANNCDEYKCSYKTRVDGLPQEKDFKFFKKREIS